MTSSKAKSSTRSLDQTVRNSERKVRCKRAVTRGCVADRAGWAGVQGNLVVRVQVDALCIWKIAA